MIYYKLTIHNLYPKELEKIKKAIEKSTLKGLKYPVIEVVAED